MRIHIAALGGTIASTPTSSGGVSPNVSGEDIARAAHIDTIDTAALFDSPAARALGAEHESTPLRLTFEQVAQVGSGSLTLHHLLQVVEAARRAAEDGASGMVLTQGTDTLEETAFALSRLNDSGIPIVVTGAMRNPSLAGADGGANVRSAVIAALAPQLHRIPCVLVMADEIHDPVFVRKDHTSFVHAFSSGPAAGPLGWVTEDRVIMPHVPAEFAIAPRVQFPGLTAEAEIPGAAVVAGGLGDSLGILDHIADAGYAGCVIAGVGGGHVPEAALPAVERLVEQMPVVYSSRTGSGAALENTYGYPGGEIGLQKMGLHPSGVLEPFKARLQLRLALAAGADISEAFACFRP